MLFAAIFVHMLRVDSWRRDAAPCDAHIWALPFCSCIGKTYARCKTDCVTPAAQLLALRRGVSHIGQRLLRDTIGESVSSAGSPLLETECERHTLQLCISRRTARRHR